MTRPRQRKPYEYRFKIDAYTPETMPLLVLTEYLKDVAEMLGEDKSTHLIRIEKGSTCPVLKIDPEAEPKIRRRVVEIESGDAPSKSLDAYNRITKRLRDDNARKGFIVDSAGKNLIIFPVKEPAPINFGAVKQQGSLIGIPVIIGGHQEQVPIHLEGRGKEKYICYATRAIAKRIAPYFFSTYIKVEGTGRWNRTAEGQWEMLSFKITDFQPLVDEAEVSLKESIKALRALPAKWKELNDPVAEILKMRHGDC